jgi:hypothetical protein
MNWGYGVRCKAVDEGSPFEDVRSLRNLICRVKAMCWWETVAVFKMPKYWGKCHSPSLVALISEFMSVQAHLPLCLGFDWQVDKSEYCASVLANSTSSVRKVVHFIARGPTFPEPLSWCPGSPTHRGQAQPLLKYVSPRNVRRKRTDRNVSRIPLW